MKGIAKRERKHRLSSEFKAIFDALPDGIIICDSKGLILRIDPAALKLFEVASERLCLGIDYRQFLQAHQTSHVSLTLEPWMLSLALNGAMPAGQREELLVLQLPSRRQVYASIRSCPFVAAQKYAKGTLYVLQDITHRYQQACHLQRVHRALMALKEAIMHLPEHLDCPFEEDIFLLSLPVLLISQQLVEVIHEVLDCERAGLLAIGPGTGGLYYAVGSGFTPEQEQYRLKVRGCFLPSDFVDETVIARLNAHQEVILSGDSLRLPAGMQQAFVSRSCLLMPLFLEDRLAGALVIEKAGAGSLFTQELSLQSEQASSYLKQVQAPLGAAAASISVQERAISDLIDVFRIQSNTLKLQLQRCDLVTLLQEVVIAQQRLAPGRRIMLEIPPEEHGVPIVGDAKRIKQVISNYLANALESNPGTLLFDLCEVLQVHPGGCATGGK